MAWFTRHIQRMISRRKGRSARRPATFILVLALLLTSLGGALTSPAAAQSAAVTVILTIERLQDLEKQDDCSAAVDYYAKVTLNGGPEIRSSTADDDSDLNNPPADWSDLFSTTVAIDPSVPTSIPITIDVEDEDPFFFCLGNSFDDVADISPITDRTQLLLDVNLGGGLCSITGDVSGFCGPSLTAQGNGDDDFDTLITFHVDVINSTATGDRDGDGLPDEWEQKGVTINGEFIDLHTKLGADPDHKDIFIELDTMPGQAIPRDDIQQVRDAFNAAPLSAGSKASALPHGVDAPPNPDKNGGINIHIDTGAAVMGSEDGLPPSCRDGVDNGENDGADGQDPDCTSTGIEDGARDDTCNDGRDNNLDGFTDGDDLDCHIGDDLGGGGLIATRQTCGLNSQFYAIKKANFNPNRRRIFHYMISGVPLAGPCDSDDDLKIDDFDNDGKSDPPFGGLGELGGNDFIDYNHNGATLIHELGHNLNLRHGGDKDSNCKPNYVSIMNYDYPLGIQQSTGAVILDYSPPRITPDGSKRGAATLLTLKENNLDENTILDSSDSVNFFVFADLPNNKVQAPLNLPVNWDGLSTTVKTGLTVNIDTSGTITVFGKPPFVGPPACTNNVTNSQLTGHDDWSRISLPFRQFGDAADAAVNPEGNDYPTREEGEALVAALNTTDLALAMTSSPEPVAAGTQLTYSLTVTNNGPNPAIQTQIADTLPAGVSFASGGPGCSAAGATVTCDLGVLLAQETRTATIVVNVAADLVFKNGGPATLANSASVSNLAGPDKDTSNNATTTQTQVVAVADLGVRAVAALNPPARVLIGKPVALTLQATVGNDGPSSPMDAALSLSAAAAAGASVTPATASVAVPALAVGAPQTVKQTFTVACTAPGFHTYTFTAAIAPAHAADSDPNAANNQASTTLTLDCAVPVAINIKPGGNPNSINLGSEIVPLAVLTTRAGEYGLPLAFDATRIDPLSVRFGPVSVGPDSAQEVHDTGHLEDSRELGVKENVKDGDVDMLLHFEAAESGLQLSDTQGCVLGEFVAADGNRYRFFGCDAIVPIQ